MNRNEEIEYLNIYYSGFDESSRLSCKSNSVEYLTTMKYMNKYLKMGMKILEIGAGTGTYSLALAEQGYEVDAVELVQHNIDVFKSGIKENYNVTVTQGDACNLNFIESEKYDITLLLGPMYHLFSEKDKLNALSEAIRVTKKGGIIFIAYISMDIHVYNLFIHNEVEKYKQKGLLDAELNPQCTPEELFSFHRKEDINNLLSHFDVQRLHFVGTDMLHKFMKNTVDSMDESTFNDYLKFHFSVCEREDMTGLSNHLLDVVLKG